RRAGAAARGGRQVVRRAHDVDGTGRGAAPRGAGARVSRVSAASSRTAWRFALGASRAGPDSHAVPAGVAGRLRGPEAVGAGGEAARPAGHAAPRRGWRSLLQGAQAVG